MIKKDEVYNMDFLKEKVWRENHTWTDIFPLTLGLAYALLFVGVIISNVLGADKWGCLFNSDPDVVTFMGVYANFFGIWLSVLFVAIIFKGNRPMLKCLVPEKKSKIVTGILIGLLFGFAFNSLNVAGSILLGNLKLSFNAIEIKTLIGFLLFVMIQSGAEELLARFFCYQKLRRRYKNPAVAVIGNSLLFLIMHLNNHGLNLASYFELFLWGVLFSLIILYFDNLWACIAIHTAWNFTQNIIYGLPNSGKVSMYSIFRLDAATNDFFFDTGFGVEGSWGAVLFITIAIAILIIIFKDKEANDLWEGWTDPYKTNAN